MASMSAPVSGSVSTAPLTSWARVASSNSPHPWKDEAFGTDMIQHKAQVPPIFLAYHRVQPADAGPHLPLFQVASAVAHAMGGSGLDAVQPIWLGWCIYMHTQADRALLIEKRLVIAGKHITLCSELTSKQHESEKVTLKDLPLHSISNEEVLEALKQCCPVQSEVKYSNL